MNRIGLCMVVFIALMFFGVAPGYGVEIDTYVEDDMPQDVESSEEEELDRSTGRGQEQFETYDEDTGLPDITESDRADELW